MTERFEGSARTALRLLSLGLALLFVVLYVAIFLLRFRYPFELEWLEGAMRIHVQRVLSGEALYVAPSIDFVPLLYTPLYYWLSAVLTIPFGEGFPAMRLLSFVASLASFSLVFLLVWKETRDRFSALVAAGLFAATFTLSAGWFDIARSDSLFLALLLATALVVRHFDSPLFLATAAGLGFLAFLAKQSALPVLAALAFWCVLERRRRSLPFVLVLAVLGLGGTWLLDVRSGGWFTFYVFRMPSQHPFAEGMTRVFFLDDLLAPLPIALLFALSYLIATFDWRSERFRFWGVLSLSMMFVSWSSRAHTGGLPNVLMPAHAVVAVLLGLALHRALAWSRERESRGGGVEAPTYLALVLQFTMLLYDPSASVPSAADREAGEQLLARLEGIEGDVFIPHHGYLMTLTGRKSFAHSALIADVTRSREGEVASRLTAEIEEAVRNRRFSAIVLDSDGWVHTELIDRHYDRAGALFQDPDVFWPRTGHRTRPESLYLRRDE